MRGVRGAVGALPRCACTGSRGGAEREEARGEQIEGA